MWQTGRKAARARVGDGPVDAAPLPRRVCLPPIEPPTHPLADRARAIGLWVGRGARWLLLGVTLSAVGWVLVQNGLCDGFAMPGTVAFWTRIAAGFAAAALIMHLRKPISAVSCRFFGLRRARHDPFARLAADARAARAMRG